MIFSRINQNIYKKETLLIISIKESRMIQTDRKDKHLRWYISLTCILTLNTELEQATNAMTSCAVEKSMDFLMKLIFKLVDLAATVVMYLKIP
jgi:hypothetical protein